MNTSSSIFSALPEIRTPLPDKRPALQSAGGSPVRKLRKTEDPFVDDTDFTLPSDGPPAPPSLSESEGKDLSASRRPHYRKVYRLVKEKKMLPSQAEVDDCIEESDDKSLAPTLRSLIESLLAEKKTPKTRLRLFLKKEHKKSGSNTTPSSARQGVLSNLMATPPQMQLPPQKQYDVPKLSQMDAKLFHGAQRLVGLANDLYF